MTSMEAIREDARLRAQECRTIAEKHEHYAKFLMKYSDEEIQTFYEIFKSMGAVFK